MPTRQYIFEMDKRIQERWVLPTNMVTKRVFLMVWLARTLYCISFLVDDLIHAWERLFSDGYG